MTTGPSVSLSGKGVTGGVQPTLHGSGAGEAAEPFDSGSGATPVTVPDVIEWREPPPARTRRGGNFRWQQVASELRAHPGQWAVIAMGQPKSQAGNLAANINRGAGLFAPAGAFEATSRSDATFARYVGEPEASALTKQEAAATQTCQPRHSGFNADQTSPVQSIGAVHPAALPPSPAPTAQGTPHNGSGES